MDVVLNAGIVHSYGNIWWGYKGGHIILSAVFLFSLFSKYFVCGR